MSPRWRDSLACTHSNDDVCPTCDFDGYYEDNYPGCPWRNIAQIQAGIIADQRERLRSLITPTEDPAPF